PAKAGCRVGKAGRRTVCPPPPQINKSAWARRLRGLSPPYELAPPVSQDLQRFASIHSRLCARQRSFRGAARPVANARQVDFARTILWLRKSIMKSTAIALSRSRLASGSSLAARLPHFIALMKPRVMALAIFTALVGLMIAPVRLDPLLGLVAMLAIAAGAGAAGVLNMWYEADIDAVMTRTAGRPIPRGAVSRPEALAFGLILACGAVAVLALALNVTAAALLAFTIFFYVVVYTMWLKRSTP